jgi:ferredoxin
MCEITVPEVFLLQDSGLATVREGERIVDGGGSEQTAVPVPTDLQASVRATADACPGACIHCVP